jgi:hypothetical protein
LSTNQIEVDECIGGLQLMVEITAGSVAASAVSKMAHAGSASIAAFAGLEVFAVVMAGSNN